MSRRSEDGSVKQKRWYGPEGEAVRDRDYNHSGDMDFPHDHEWINGRRQKDHLKPSPEYQMTGGVLEGTFIMIACGIGAALIIGDDLIGIGIVEE